MVPSAYFASVCYDLGQADGFFAVLFRDLADGDDFGRAWQMFLWNSFATSLFFA